MRGNRIYQNLNEDTCRAAGTQGAPLLIPTTIFKKVDIIPYDKDIRERLFDLVTIYDFICAVLYAATLEDLFHLIYNERKAASFIIQKPGKIINADKISLYSKIGMAVSRANFPGNILRYLTPRDCVPDYWQIDGVRLFGNIYTGLKRWDEDRPELHPKRFIFGNFDKKGLMKPKCVFEGSWNATENSSKSINHMLEIQSENYAARALENWAHTYSWSEGLWRMRPGLYSEFHWNDNTRAKSVLRPESTCPKCGSRHLVFYPISPIEYALRCYEKDCGKGTLSLKDAGIEN